MALQCIKELCISPSLSPTCAPSNQACTCLTLEFTCFLFRYLSVLCSLSTSLLMSLFLFHPPSVSLLSVASHALSCCCYSWAVLFSYCTTVSSFFRRLLSVFVLKQPVLLWWPFNAPIKQLSYGQMHSLVFIMLKKIGCEWQTEGRRHLRPAILIL